MNCTRTLVLAALAAPLLCSSIAPGDSLAYRPASGTKLSRSWVVKQDMTLDEMNMTMNGQPLPMDLQMDMDMTNETKIDVSDTIVSFADGRPSELRRSYDSLGSASSFNVEMPQMPEGGMEQSTTGSSKLQGKTVQFKWDAEKGEYAKAYHESEGEADLLEGIELDMDLAGLLPKDEKEVGDTWDIDVKELRALLMPGGDVGIRPEDKGEEGAGMPGMDGMGDLKDLVGDLLEGSAKAEYIGIQDIEGGKFAVIKLKIDIESSNDLSDKIEEMAGAIAGAEMDVEHMDLEFALEAEGTLLWDVASGHVRKLDLTGKSTMKMDIGMSIDAQGQSMKIEQQMAMSGTMSIALDVTRD